MQEQEVRDVFDAANRIWQAAQHHKKLEALVVPAAVKVARALIRAVPAHRTMLAKGYQIQRPALGFPCLAKMEPAGTTQFTVGHGMKLYHAYQFAKDALEVSQIVLKDVQYDRDKALEVLRLLSAVGKKFPQETVVNSAVQ